MFGVRRGQPSLLLQVSSTGASQEISIGGPSLGTASAYLCVDHDVNTARNVDGRGRVL